MVYGVGGSRGLLGARRHAQGNSVCAGVLVEGTMGIARALTLGLAVSAVTAAPSNTNVSERVFRCFLEFSTGCVLFFYSFYPFYLCLACVLIFGRGRFWSTRQ